MSLLEHATRNDTPPWFERSSEPGLSADFEPSPAGPVSDEDAPGQPVPHVGAGRTLQTIRLGRDIGGTFFKAQREAGEVFSLNTRFDPRPVVVVSHPDHIKSLVSQPDLAPSVTGESPIRPIVGLSVLTANGAQHRRRRKLLMPPFHGEAIAAYREQIRAATARELDGWSTGTPFALAPAAQAITLDVIMAGIFGIEGELTDAEAHLRERVLWLLRMSMSRLALVGELINAGRQEPVGLLKWALVSVDRAIYAVIGQRRKDHVPAERNDILSLLLDARDEEGKSLTDEELRNELLTLVLAGHETTANTIAWAFERLLRNPDSYDRLRDAVRSDDDGGYLDATIHEAMRVRPVVPVIGRRATLPWQFGDVVAPKGARILVGIVLTHHRPDVYPDPFRFNPERFMDVKPSTSEWLPFGGGNRRCLGAALAMEEMRIVLGEIARRTDLAVTDDAPERPKHRNVTMIPGQGGRVIATAVRR
ncbi:MAG TPA: cytochrome P450 [Vicinamibacterales bacterium]|nr:cytochrome P450 [Vicinamibacterales bacterium]